MLLLNSIFFDLFTEKPIATIFVIMLASIVTNIEGNPIPSNEPHQKYWWHEPCTPRTKHSGRHTRDIPNTVRTQINITYHRMLKIYGEHKSQMHVSVIVIYLIHFFYPQISILFRN